MRKYLAFFLCYFLIPAFHVFGQESGTYFNKSEASILNQGRIEPAAHVFGGIAGTIFGFGFGHAVQGRWKNGGSTIALVEGGSLATAGLGAYYCLDSLGEAISEGESKGPKVLGCIAMAAGAIVFTGAKLYEIYDAWMGPFYHNDRYKELKKIQQQAKVTFRPYLAPTFRGDGVAAGLNIQF